MKLLFCGDIVINHPSDFKISDEVKNIINIHDIRCCNFEAPIVNIPDDFHVINKAGPHISQTEKSAECVIRTGFNIISLANNHIMDYDERGLQQTLDYFKKKGVPTIGAGFSFKSVYAPFLFTDENNNKIAILSLAQAEFGVFKSINTTSGYAWVNNPEVTSIINYIKKDNRILILLVHAGLENEIIPLPEWQARYRYFIDIGADLIIASHPHIVQGYEIYKQKLICYSLGNFYFDQDELRNNIEWNRSILISIDTNQLDNPKIIPIFVKNYTIFKNDEQSFKNDIYLRSSYLYDPIKLEQTADDLAIKLWQKYYKSYYENIIYRNEITEMSFFQILKYLFKRYFIKIKISSNEINETLLLHNIQIESHRWLVERYLYNQNIKKKSRK
jgi:poly-gamma-glutamate synthesis protein (capsule biosynthesis protein)